jgi:putative DNA primase/helicase
MRQITTQGEHNRSVAQLYAPPELEDIRNALYCIPSDIEYKYWYRIGAALKLQLGEAGFSLFNDWSAGCDLYQTREVLQKWRSFRRSGGAVVNIQTLFMLAIQNGWHPTKEFDCKPPPVDTARLRREESERKERQVSTALEASQDWKRAKPVTEHPYLEVKNVSPHGTRIEGNKILVPMRIGKKLWSLQSIYPNGSKWFLKGARAKGTYFGIGALTPRLWIAEGFATGATVHEVTGEAVACALSGENMRNVAAWFRNNHQYIELLIASDSGRAGIAYGTAAMNAGHATHMVYPDFKPRDEGSDWNDYSRHYGTEETFKALSSTEVISHG